MRHVSHSKREAFKLMLAAFISQSGSHFLTLALSAFVLVASDSVVGASLVFVLSYLPSVVCSGRLGELVDRRLSKSFLVLNELFSALLSLACGACLYYASLGWLCVALAARSLLLFPARAGATKWLKLTTPPKRQAARI